MPIPLGAIVAGIGAIGGAIMGAKDNKAAREQQAHQNQMDREFQLDMWNRTNAYNNPMEQMKRLRAAGLNPNLVYGNGADVTAANQQLPQSRPLPHPNTGAMITSAVDQIYDLSMKEMQKDLMAIEVSNKTQNIAESQVRSAKMAGVDTNKVIADTYGTYQNIRKSKVEMAGQGIRNERDLFELGKARELRQNSMDVANESLRNIQLRNVQQELQNSQMPERHKLAILESYSRLKMAESTMSVQAVDELLKKEQLQLRQQGIEVSDSLFARIFGNFLQDGGLEKLTKEPTDGWFNDWFGKSKK